MATKKAAVVGTGEIRQIATGDYLTADSLGSGSAGGGQKILTDNNTFVSLPAGSFGCPMNGSGGVVSTGSKGFITIPYAFTITQWYVTGNASGSCVIDLKVAGVSIIGAGNKPTLTSAQRNNGAVSGWTTTVFTAFTEIEFNLDSVTTLSGIYPVIVCTKTL